MRHPTECPPYGNTTVSGSIALIPPPGGSDSIGIGAGGASFSCSATACRSDVLYGFWISIVCGLGSGSWN
jgi:hypothetical protein